MLNENKVIIIIPTYNEAQTISRTLIQLEQEIDKVHPYDIQILFIDSNSTDNTIKEIKKLQAQFTNLYLITEAEKTGLGSAYKKAMIHAMEKMQANVIFEYDADGSHQPKYILPMLNTLYSGFDVVVGSRYIKGGSIPSNWVWYRQLLSRAGNWFSQVMLSKCYKDYTSGFRATKSSFLKKIEIEKLLFKNYTYKIELFWRLHHAGAKITEFPIDFIDRDAGVSKFPRNNIIASLCIVMRLKFTNFSKKY